MPSALQHEYLRAMGIDVWQDKYAIPIVEDVPEVIHTKAPAEASLSSDLQSLAKEVSVCEACSLAASRTQTVFGTGDSQAEWLIIGEAPGQEEDKQGKPFVGKAGQLLTSMLRALGYAREQVFIANILKCRPPNNRDPQPEEVNACASFLNKQIELIQPKVILCVGRIAAQNLLQIDTPIGKMRGNQYTHPSFEIPVLVTYHPAYLLRSPREKRKVWKDLCIAKQNFESIQ